MLAGVATLSVACPSMDIDPIDAQTRQTAEIVCQVTVVLNGQVLAGKGVFAACLVHRQRFLHWLVDPAPFQGNLEDGSIQFTIEAERCFGPVALPAFASGSILMPDGSHGLIDRTLEFPACLARPLGGESWQVPPVTGTGTVLFS
jgi:hypothetical protein